MTKPSGQGRRLLFVINAAITGGAERHTAQLARALPEYGFSTSVFAIKQGTEKPEGVALHEPQIPASLWQRTRALAEFIEANDIDVIVPVNQRPLAAAFLARGLARGRQSIVPIFHTTVLRNRKEHWMQRVYTPLFNRSDSVIFISDNQRRYWESRGLRNARAVTILNGIDVARFSPQALSELRAPTRRSLGFNDGDFVLGCIAVLRAEKNHLQLIDAVADLRNKRIPARALIVGDGPMRAAIEQRVQNLKLTDHVTFTGMQNDVRPYLAAIDIGILCSTSIETLSLSALEVMAAGKPMVMSDIGGASEIVDGESGATFPPGDIRALVAAIQRFAPPADRAAGAAAYQSVTRRFAAKTMLDAYADLFQSPPSALYNPEKPD